MPHIISESERTQNGPKNFFIPSPPGVLLLFLVGAILLVLFSFSQIFNWIGNDYLGTADRLDLSIKVFNNGLGNSFDSALGGRLGQVVVWSLIGALAYILIWFIKNMFNSVENDIIVDHYLHPKNFNRAKYLSWAFGGLMVFVALLIITVVYTFVGLKVILPAAASLTSSSVSHFHSVNSALYILLSLLICTLAVYVWMILLKLLARTWHLL
jgi:hypothetical protein